MTTIDNGNNSDPSVADPDMGVSLDFLVEGMSVERYLLSCHGAIHAVGPDEKIGRSVVPSSRQRRTSRNFSCGSFFVFSTSISFVTPPRMEFNFAIMGTVST